LQRLQGLPHSGHLVAESERSELDDLSVAVITRSTRIAL
jgi:hypothetical protein